MKSTTRPKNILTRLAGAAGILLFLLPILLQAQQRAQTSTGNRPALVPRSAVSTTASDASGNDPRQKAIVDYYGDLMTKRAANDSTIYLIGSVAFHHNGTFIQCDSAHRYDDYRLEGFGNVIINKDSTYIYGDRVSYNGHTNIAKVYSPLLKLVNGDATMWVNNYMEFDTQTNIGKYTEGGLIVQRDNLMESDRGVYNGDSSLIKFIDRVAMRNDNYKMRTDSIGYNLHNEIITFLTKTYIWDKERDFLTADAGNYVRSTETYHFTRNAYVMTADQEFWADTMTYESAIRKAVMLNNIQILDTAQRSIGLGDYGYYSDSLKKGMLTRRPAIINYDQADTLRTSTDAMAIADSTGSLLPADIRDSTSIPLLPDTTAVWPEGITSTTATTSVPDSAFMRADTIYFDSYPPGGSKPKALIPISDSITDRTIADSTYRADTLVGPPAIPGIPGMDSVHKVDSIAEFVGPPAIPGMDSIYKVDSIAEFVGPPAIPGILAMDSVHKVDTLVEIPGIVSTADSTNNQADSTEMEKRQQPMIGVEEPPDLARAAGSIGAVDSLSLSQNSLRVVDTLLTPIVRKDSTAQGKDTLERVIRAFYNVKLYRTDMQGICDSLISFSVDSTASLFGRPIIWNGDNQLTADRIDIYSDNEELDYAEFIGNPFITQQVELADTLFNQAQCRNMETWFRNNEIYRAILTGNVLNYYYMADEGEAPDKFATISCAGLTIDFENREAIRMNWSGSGNSVIYPIDKIPADQSQRLPGFSWVPDLKPKSRWEITDRSVRPSQRTAVDGYTQPDFVLETQITKHREQLLKGGVWRDRNELKSVTLDTFRRNGLLF